MRDRNKLSIYGLVFKLNQLNVSKYEIECLLGYLNIPDVITPAVRSLETVNNQFASALVRIADLTFIIKPALHRLRGKGLTINPKSAKR